MDVMIGHGGGCQCLYTSICSHRSPIPSFVHSKSLYSSALHLVHPAPISALNVFVKHSQEIAERK